MRLNTGRKNPYQIYFPKTDKLGRSALSQSEVRGQFTDHCEAGLMDHSGSIEEASEDVVLFLFDPDLMHRNLAAVLTWPLLPHEATKWRTRREAAEYFLSCRNAQFRSDEITTRVPGNGELRMRVQAMHGA
jgi:hypothetical protein